MMLGIQVEIISQGRVALSKLRIILTLCLWG